MKPTKAELKKAKNLLNKYAPKGEELAYINSKEAKLLKRMGGAGKDINGTGIKSYFDPGSGRGSVSESLSESAGLGSSSSGGGGGGGGSSNDDNNDYMDYYVSPAPATTTRDVKEAEFATGSYTAPEEDDDTSGEDNEEIQAREKEAFDEGFRTDAYNDLYGITTEEDKGDKLYVSPTQTMKEEEPYYGYTPGPNTVTADELSNFNKGIGDIDELGATFSKIQAVNPIEKQGFIDSGIGKALKYAGLTLTGAGAFGPTLAKGANLYSQFDKTKATLNFMNKLTKGKTPTYAELINKPQGTNVNKPPTGFEGSNDDRPTLVANNVIAKSRQRFSPSQTNQIFAFRDGLLNKAERGTLNQQDAQYLTQVNKLIEEYLV